MIDTAFVEQRMRDINPVPAVDDIDADELSCAVAAARRRTAAIEPTPAQQQTPAPHSPSLRQSRRVWAFAAAFILILASVGIAALALRMSDAPVTDKPAPPTTVAATLEEPISVDSLTWTRVSLGTKGPRVVVDMPGFDTPTTSIARGGLGLVAAGDSPSTGADQPTVWMSPDGYEWSQVPYSDDTIGILDSGEEVTGIARRDDLLVVVAETRAWTSSDGITWSRVPEGTFQHNVDRLRGVIAGGPGFVAFGENESSHRAAVWTSLDGNTWTRAPDDPTVFSGDIHAMTVGGPGLVAVGARHGDCAPVVWTSTDGYRWTRLPHDPAVFGREPRCGLAGPGEMRIRDISTGGPGLVAVGSHGEQAAVWTSPDGVTWNRVPNDPAVFDVRPHEQYSEMTNVAAVGDGLVAVGRKGGVAAIWISHDGSAWTDITDDLEMTEYEGMVQVIAGGPGVVILSLNQIETVVWIGGPGK